MTTPDDFKDLKASEPSLLAAANKEAQTIEDGATKVRREVHAIAVWTLRFGAIIIGCLILIRVWHLVGPAGVRWLDNDDLQSIDKMLFSSAFGGMALGYLKEILRPLPK